MATQSKSFPVLPKLVNSKAGGARIYTRTIDTSVSALAERLKGSKTRGRFSLDLVDDGPASFKIDLDGSKAVVGKGHDEKAQLHIATTKATWLEVTSGRLSPAEAYLSGKMRVTGDMGFIKRVYSLASRQELVDFNF